MIHYRFIDYNTKLIIDQLESSVQLIFGYSDLIFIKAQKASCLSPQFNVAENCFDVTFIYLKDLS